MEGKQMLRTLSVFWMCLSISLIATNTYAVDVFKVSDFGGGHQIWFEVEAFDARDENSENVDNMGFKLVDAETNIDLPDGAFGDAVVNVRASDTIWLLYNFDISETGGKGGTWYIWSREINPTNKSEFLWVMGDDGDEIPDVKPAFVVDDDRIFDMDTGPPWAWAKGNREGEIKQLQDGENTMMIWYRQGDRTALRDVFVWTDNAAYVPKDDDYMNADEIRLKPEAAEPAGKLAATWGALKDEP
jgi:hypothetical protein